MTELRVFYRIPWFTAFLQWVMPLLIVMAVVFLAPSLEGSSVSCGWPSPPRPC